MRKCRKLLKVLRKSWTALYEGITIIFLAQLAGIELSLAAQLGVAYLAILGGIGTAGVPGGSIPYIIVVLAGLGVNPAIIAIILGGGQDSRYVQDNCECDRGYYSGNFCCTV